MLHAPFYDPKKTYEDNFAKGPFGIFSNKEVFVNEGAPNYTFFGHKVYSPFGIPAGPLINGNFARAAMDKGFDIVTYKTVRTKAYPCHPWPNILSVETPGDLTLKMTEGKLIASREYREPLSITNSFGVPSRDPDFWQKDLAHLVKNTRVGQIIVGGFQGTKSANGNGKKYIQDFCIAARLLKETGVKALEVNLSCPNEGIVDVLCFDIKRSAEVAYAIKDGIGDLPLIAKVGYYKDDNLLEHFVKEVGLIVDGISAINTITSEIVNEDGSQALPGEGRLHSGVCGSSIKLAGLDMVKKLARLREELGRAFIIIGVGGVMNADDFEEYKKAGADIVMSATGAMWNPYLAKEIKELK